VNGTDFCESANFLHRNASRGRRRRQADDSGILNGGGPILSLLNNIFGSNGVRRGNRGIFGSRGNSDNSFRLFPAPVVTGGNGGFNLIPAPRGRARRQAVAINDSGVLYGGPIFGFLNSIVRSLNGIDGFELIPANVG